MGIYVHGMKMPQFGGCIVITSDGVARKYLKGDVAIHYDAIQDKASAAELPPHGRLGDLDALFLAMFKCQDGSIIGDYDIDGWPHEARYADIKRFIRQAPTIIPADPAGGADNG